MSPKRLVALGARGIVALALALGSACASGGPTNGAADAGPGGADAEVAGAGAWLAGDAVLPSRAEVIAVADRLAIEAVKNERTGRAAELRILAGDLRARLYRGDGLDTDAREALELYAAALRDAPVDEASCEVARRRATLAGELAGDAGASQRELFVTKRRQAARLGDAASRSACIARIDRDLAMLGAYRPTGAALEALEAEADRAARELSREAPQPASSGALVAPSSSPASPMGSAQVVSPGAAMAAKGPVQLTKIETYPAENGGRVVLHLSGVTTFEVGTLAADATGDKGPRIYLDLARAKAKGVPAETNMGGGVDRVRVGKRDDGSRIVLDLKSALFHRVFYLPEPFRIVVDLSSRAPEADPRTAEGKRVLKRVAIDPGHGGYDSGAVGPTGLREKDVALDVAHRVAPLLAHELHVETLLTRDGDVFVPLEERTARANAFHADLFVSIHCNASENGDARGVETFVLDPSREGRASARIVALENGLFDSKRPPSPQKVDAEVEKALGRLTIGDNGARSRQFGELLQRATLASMAKRYDGTRDHGVKTAVFYVLAGAEMPAVLYETSFISNPDDEARLATADYRQKLADAVVNAVRAYRDGK